VQREYNHAFLHLDDEGCASIQLKASYVYRKKFTTCPGWVKTPAFTQNIVKGPDFFQDKHFFQKFSHKHPIARVISV